jgi:thiamine-monophosphate kinase
MVRNPPQSRFRPWGESTLFSRLGKIATLTLCAAIPYYGSYESILGGFRTTVLMASERQLIERTGRKLPSRTGHGVRIGIGDDAAVISPRGGYEWVLTTDAFLENVHFLLEVHPPEAVGYKALARATSDLAAMGARPRYFLLNLALPPSCTKIWFDRFLTGMSRAARSFGLVLVGGDTTRCPLVAINLTVIGEAAHGRTILRSGARPGDFLCVSGRLGEAEMGLQLLQRGLGKRKKWKSLLKKHFYPEPRLALGEWLAKSGKATAMIDTSDGLSTDLAHVCEASGVGARLWAEEIPKVVVPRSLQKLGLDPLRLALDGGEDYELLFTVPRRLARRLPRVVRGVPVTIIGEITREKRILLIDTAGRIRPLPAQGWDPFRKPSARKRS